MTRTQLPGPELLDRRDLPSVSFDQNPIIPTWDSEVVANIRHIASVGRQLGRNPSAFLKVGDSNSERDGYLYQLGNSSYSPILSGLAARYPELLDTWSRYQTPLITGENSFSRHSAAVKAGWAIPNVMAGLGTEIATSNAAVAVIMIGSNDQILYGTDTYRAGLNTLLDTLIGSGVIPIVSSIPEIASSWGRDNAIRAFNQVIADTCAEKHIPYVNEVKLQRTLPGIGLGEDNIHFDTSPNGGGYFESFDLLFGQNARNLVTLEALDQVYDWALANPTSPIMPTTAPGWQALQAGDQIGVVTGDVGTPPIVRVVDPTSGVTKFWFNAYESAFTGGIHAAVADVTGDGIPDIITVPADGSTHVKVFSGADGSVAASFFAYEPSFTGGASLAVGDLDGDGKPEIVVGAGVGGAPRVRVFAAGNATPIHDFFAYESAARGGVNVAVGNFGGGIGQAIVTGAGIGGGPIVKVFGFTSDDPIRTFVPFDVTQRGGVSVAAGDLNADGTSELVVSPGTGAAVVRVLDGDNGSEKVTFTAGTGTQHGARVAVEGGNILVGNGTGDPTVARAFNATGGLTSQLLADPDTRNLFGTFVG